MLRDLGHKWETVANAVKKLKVRPYKKQKTPQLDSRIQTQRLTYATLGPVAQLVLKGEWEEKKHTLAWVDYAPTSKNGVANSSHDPCWLTPPLVVPASTPWTATSTLNSCSPLLCIHV